MIYIISFTTSFVIALSYLVIALLVLPRMDIRRDLRLFGMAILSLDALRTFLGAVLVLYSFIALHPDQPAVVVAWVIVSLAVPHAALALWAAIYGLCYWREPG